VNGRGSSILLLLESNISPEIVTLVYTNQHVIRFRELSTCFQFAPRDFKLILSDSQLVLYILLFTLSILCAWHRTMPHGVVDYTACRPCKCYTQTCVEFVINHYWKTNLLQIYSTQTPGRRRRTRGTRRSLYLIIKKLTFPRFRPYGWCRPSSARFVPHRSCLVSIAKRIPSFSLTLFRPLACSRSQDVPKRIRLNLK
jgi:hypothetical protein